MITKRKPLEKCRDNTLIRVVRNAKTAAKRDAAKTILLSRHEGLIRVQASGKTNYDDLLQEGRIGILQAIDTFDLAQDVKFSTWAYHKIRGRITSALYDVTAPARRARKVLFFPTTKSEDGPDIFERSVDADEQQSFDVADMMALLTDTEKTVLKQRFWGEKTYKDIGHDLDCSHTRIWTIERQALAKLRKVVV